LHRLSDSEPAITPAQPIEPLTDREEDVLLVVARGSTNAEIATALSISVSTVKFHLAGLMTKLAARNRVELALWAYATRLLGSDR
jgi:DNA-binding NarL/FixJ family response regulator